MSTIKNKTTAGDLAAKLPAKKAAAKKTTKNKGKGILGAIPNIEHNKELLDQAIGKVESDGTKEFELSDGRIVKVIESKGYHCEAAQEISEGGLVTYTMALMAQVVTIDGKAIVAEDLKFMRGRDYMLIQANFGQVNFL
jgi:hypothetical protein